MPFLYLDTEFNGFGGELISIAMCSSTSKEELYAVRHLPANVNCWVRENVVPLLVADAEPDHLIRERVYSYLCRHQGHIIIADWPEDFTHLLSLLCEPNGFQRHVPGGLRLHLIQQTAIDPKLPHNALSDARALRDWHTREWQHSCGN